MLALTLLLIAVAFVIAVPATGAARALGRRLNALDTPPVPGQVKAPARRVPNTGGLAIFLGVALPLGAALALVSTDGLGPRAERFHPLAAHLPGLKQVAPAGAVLLACLAVLHILGLIDDRRPLGPRLKLAIMLAVAVVAVIGTDSRLMTALDGPAGGPWLSVLITVLWIGVITNAFNFLDNMDGLAAGLAAISAAGFLTTTLVSPSPQWFVAGLLALVVGASLGFLVFNFPFTPRARTADGQSRGGASIFMGDGGSLVLGFLLAIASVRMTYVPAHPPPAPVHGGLGVDHAVALADPGPTYHLLLIPLVILAVPLYDFTSVTLIRLSQGKSPFVGDLQHFSHRLVRQGLSARAAVLVIYGCASATAIGGIAMTRLEPWQGVLVGMQTLLILGVLAGYEWARRA